MQILGIISLIIAGCCFLGGAGQDYVTQQATYFLCWLGFGLAGMGCLILNKFNAMLACLNRPIAEHKAPNPEDTLARLAALHKQGVLTKEEFEAKKTELLK